MKGLFKRNQVALIILGLGLMVSYGLFVGKPLPVKDPTPTQAVPLVQTISASPKPHSVFVKTQGTIEPHLQIDISSQVSGLVVQTAADFSPGSYFNSNEALVKIETADYEYAVAKAASQLAAAKQRVAEEQGRALQAKRQWRELGSSEANALFLREPQLAAAKAAHYAAVQELEAAKRNLARTQISAPFNGRVISKFVDIGQFVVAGAKLARVHSTDTVQVRLPLTDRQVALLDLPLRQGDGLDTVNDNKAESEVELSAKFGNQFWNWEAKIVRTEAQIDVQSRVLYAVAEIQNPFESSTHSDRPPLSPGMFVSAEIKSKQFDGVTEIPRYLLRNNSTVLLVDGQHIKQVYVEVIKSNKEKAWITGLESDQEIIVGNTINLKSGMKVIVGNPEQVVLGPGS